MRSLGFLEETRTFRGRPARFRPDAQEAGAGNVVVSTDRPTDFVGVRHGFHFLR
jgi:hypothetical protein